MFLSKYDFIREGKINGVLGVIDDRPLKIIDRNVENTSLETCFLRVGSLHLLCIAKISVEEAKLEDMKVDSLDGKKIDDIELVVFSG